VARIARITADKFSTMSISDCVALFERHESRVFTSRIGLRPERVRELLAPPPKKDPLPDPQEIRRAIARQWMKKPCGKKKRPAAVVKALWEDYRTLGNLRAVGKLYGVNHTAVAKIFARHGMPSIRRKPAPFVIVDGLKYVADREGYFVGSRRSDMGKPLHKTLWERRHGPVPADRRLIFIDGNKANFYPENIRCVGMKEYWKHVSAHRR
jgi:hypothetical protein